MLSILAKVAGRRGKWITLAVWVVLALLLNLLLPSLGKEEDNNAQNLPDSAPSVQAAKLVAKEFPSGQGLPALMVYHREGGLSDDDLTAIQNITGQITDQPLPHQIFAVPLHKMPLQALKAQLSEDGSTLVSTVLFDKQAEASELKSSLDDYKELAAKALGGSDPFDAKTGSSELSARVTGPVGISVDATDLFKNADFSLMLSTVILVLVILLLIYRSPLLAVIPIIGVGFAYLVASPILGAMAHSGLITVDAQTVSIMTVLLFGAGTDYCLFLISRFRQLLHEEESKGKALIGAISGSSGAIAMSGFTVVVALLTLLLAKYGTYTRFAVPFGLSILVMAAASLTLIPALLAIFGRKSFWPLIPRTPRMEEEHAKAKGKPVRHVKKGKSRIGSLVVRRPWAIMIVTLVILGALASFSSQIKITFDLLSSFPKDMSSREGYELIGSKFSPGELAPVQLIIDTEGKETGLKDQLAGQDYVSRVADPEQGANNKALASYNIELKMNPYSTEAVDLIPELREQAEQSLQTAGITSPEDKVWIAGQTAEQYDTRHTQNRDTRVIIPVVIALIAILLLLYLRSLVAMVYLVATVILSYFSALGLGWLIIHYVMGADAIQGSIPLYAFVFLVALGEDYNIFMISSIWKKSRVMPLKEAIRQGVGETGAVITSAGIILAGTFAVLASLPIQVLVQFGIITALGVLLDTFLVRPFLVPAITVLLGRFAFWPGRYKPVEETGERNPSPAGDSFKRS